MCSSYQVEQKQSVVVFRICREQAANAFCRATLLALGDVARRAGHDRSVRCLFITGSGNKYFCAGADLRERRHWTQQQVLDQLALYRSELGALDQCAVPVIAAINGLALGGGLEIALACDLRIAVPHAVFGCPECSLAIIPGAGATQRLPKTIGPSRAKEMILLGRRIDSATALHWGLVNEICPTETDLIDYAMKWVEPITSGAPIAQAAALEAIDAAGLALEQGLAVEARAYGQTLATEDRIEALNAFAQKRPARFVGR